MEPQAPEELPFLQAICWQVDPVHLHRLEPMQMLMSYERGWEYRSVLAEPSPEEWTFIRKLVQTYDSWLATDFEVAPYGVL